MSNAEDFLGYLNQQQAARAASQQKATKGGNARQLQSRPQTPNKQFKGAAIGTGGRFNPGGPVKGPGQAPVSPSVPSHKSGGGGFFHDIAHAAGAVYHGTLGAENYAQQKDQLAAHDIQAMPAGLVQSGEAIAHDSAKLSGHIPGNKAGKRLGAGPYETPALGKVMLKSSYESIRHPIRDPFQTVLTAGAVASLGAGAVARGAAAADAVGEAGDEASLAVKAGAAGKALVKKPVMPNRILQNPAIRFNEKTGEWEKTSNPFQLTAAQKPIPRVIQEIHDRVIQNSLDKHNNIEGKTSIVKRYADRRVAGARNEQMRRTTQLDQGLPTMIASAGRRAFGRTPYGALSKKEGELAIALRSWQVLPHELRDRLEETGSAHAATSRAQDLVDQAQILHEKGVLTHTRGKVAINAKLYPELARVDKLAKSGQDAREAVIRKYGLMSEQGMQDRVNLPSEVLRSEAARSDTTGVRTGQSYTSLKTSQKDLPVHPRPAAESGGVIGVPKNPISKKFPATGEGILQGMVPDDTTAGIARGVKEVFDYKEKMAARDALYNDGSDISRHPTDVFVRDPHSAAKELNLTTKQALKKELSTLDTVGDEQTVHEKFLDYMKDITHPKVAQRAGIKAEGGRWVPESQVGDLGKGISPRNKFQRGADAVNSGVTAATVYAKPAHVPQRLVTDATTSAFSGALTSPGTRAFVKALHENLSEQELMDAKQASGVHGYLALPHEGDTKAARIATRGANAYANGIDARFRFMNLAHVARKAGIDTPAEFKKMLKYAKDPSKRIKIADAQKYNQVLNRSDRVSMMYDGMTAKERAGIARYMWFYPWTKAATRYAGHVDAEHPLAAGALATEGVQGRRWQQKEIGSQPDYEYGNIPFDHGKIVSNAGYLTPFNTAGQTLGIAARPTEAAQNLNPVTQAAVTAFSGLNSYGDITPGGPGYPSVKAGLSELFAPTPEAGILHDYLDQKGAAKKTHMFPHTWQNDIMTRLLGGPSYPRAYNKKAAHKAYQRQQGKGYDIFIPTK